MSRSLAASRGTPVLAFAFPSALAALALAAAALATFMLTPAALGAPGPAAASARAATLKVAVEYRRFSPYSLAALPGDTVTWTNKGGRTHTVTADGGQFDSGDLPVGGSFTQLFTTAGSYVYHCAIHSGMVGEVEVRRVTLQPLPPRAIAAGSRVTLVGRTVEPTVPVRIRRDTGRGFETVATVSPNADGTWNAQVAATKTGRYRAAVGADLSQTRRVLVISRRVQVRLTRGVISITVIPRAVHARVSLQLYLRDRFGWWPARAQRLDATSRASFRVHGPVRARVALLGRDGWTALALSPVVRVGGA